MISNMMTGGTRGFQQVEFFLCYSLFRACFQEATQYQPKVCSRKMPQSFCQFVWGSLLEHSFLEHFCLDQFSVMQGNFYIQRFSSTSFGRTLLGPNFGGLLLETFVATLRPSQFGGTAISAEALENTAFSTNIAKSGRPNRQQFPPY